jgi:hypothetical protein
VIFAAHQRTGSFFMILSSHYFVSLRSVKRIRLSNTN